MQDVGPPPAWEFDWKGFCLGTPFCSKMDDLERFLKKLEDDGYEFETAKQRKWGKWIVGTRARGGAGKGTLTGFLGGALGLTHCTLIGFFDEPTPTPDAFEPFLKDATKFVKENTAKYEFEYVIALSKERVDKRAFSSLLKDADDRMSKLIDFRVLPSHKDSMLQSPQRGPTPPSPPSVPSVTPSKLDYDAITKALPARSDRERVLYAWEVLPDQLPAAGQSYLVVTQERGVLMRKVGADFVHDLSFKWEQSGEPATEIDAGGPVLRIYDGTKEHRLRNRDAQFIQVLIHHLKYAREGWISGHMKELGFDAELINRCQPDFVGERYSLAVRNAFALLETRIRAESLAPRDKIGVDLATFAFHAENGRIPVGADATEREGVYHLFRGAFLAFRDPAAHNDQLSGVDKDTAFHQLALVDLLLKLAHRGKEQFQRGSQ